MKNRIVHALAGFLILTGLALAHFANPNWLWLSAFVGINLLQSAFTNWCLMIDILKKIGIKD